VLSRVDPPAPYVTEQNEGPRGSNSSNVFSRLRSISVVRGGMNSNEYVGPAASSSPILAIEKG